MFADAWRFGETLTNVYDPRFKSSANLQALNQLPTPNLDPLHTPSTAALFNHMLNQLYTTASLMTHQTPKHEPSQHETYPMPGFSQPQQQQQQQFFELFVKYFKNLPPKSDSPSDDHLFVPCPKNPSNMDATYTAQDLSLTKCSDSKDISLDLNNLSNSTWGTIPSPSDKPSPTANQFEILPDSKSPPSIKVGSYSNLIGSDSLQRRQPFTHLNYPSRTNSNVSISPRKSRDFYSSDPAKFYLNQLTQTPALASEGQDWNSQFKAMCDRLHCLPKSPDNSMPITSSNQLPTQIDTSPSILSANYYHHILRCQQYYESYLHWFRLLGVNRSGHTDLENGNPVINPTLTTPSGLQAPPTHQTPMRSFPYPSPMAAHSFYPLSLLESKSAGHCMAPSHSTSRHGLNMMKNKRHSMLKVLKPKSQFRHFNPNLTDKFNPETTIPTTTTCSHGSIVSTTSSSMSSLINSTEENQHFACKLCPKIYSQASALKMHVRTHTLPCRCSYCGKSFSRKWLLKGHERTHTGERPYACSICNRSFADRSNLRAHMQTHQRDKRYSCPRCPRSFSRMGLLNKHMTQCASSAAAPPPPPPLSQPSSSAVNCLSRILINTNSVSSPTSAPNPSTNRMTAMRSKNRWEIL